MSQVYDLKEKWQEIENLRAIAADSDICLKRASAWNPNIKFTRSAMWEIAASKMDILHQVTAWHRNGLLVSFRGVPIEVKG